MAPEEDELVASPGRRREFLAFLKNIRNFKGDLAGFTAPSFLLSPTSMTEMPSQWVEQQSLFVAPAAEEDPGKRALAVLKWYICTLKQQYGRRPGQKGKKPLNPFLGELFLANVQSDASGRTEIRSEQVSHHPPVTAYHIWNADNGTHMDGYHAQRTYFSGTVRIDRIGFVLLHLDKYDEDYLITLPNMHLEGLLPPPPYPELEGTTYIQSSSGYLAEIDYSGKGWLRGKKNSFIARLRDGDGTLRYLMEGQWQNGSFSVKELPEKKVVGTASTEAFELTPISVAPMEEQDPLESRRAWYKVAQGIERGDMATVNREKSKIEEAQRAMRKTEKVEGREWQTRYFSKVDSWPILEDLAEKIGVELHLEGTKGMWKWDEEKYLQSKR